MNPCFRIVVPPRAVVPGSSQASPGGHPAAPRMLFFALLMAVLMIMRRYSMMRRAQAFVGASTKALERIRILPTQDVDLLDRHQSTAVFLIGGRNDLGPIILRRFAEQHAETYGQVLFLAVGVPDASTVVAGQRNWERYLRSAEAKLLKDLTRLDLDPYLETAHQLGFKTDCRISIATDPAQEIGLLAEGIAGIYSRASFFVAKPVLESSRWYHRAIHSGPADSIQKSLESRRIPVTMIPVVMDRNALNSAGQN